MKPLDVLVSNGGNPQLIAAKLRAVPGVVGATAPPGWRRGSSSLVEGFADIDGAAPGIQGIVDRANASLKGTDGSLTGVAATGRDFLHALFGSFPYALALVLLLTLILLTRAFRSIVLAVKAVVLNLASLAAAYGIIVFVFQQGHGASLWNLCFLLVQRTAVGSFSEVTRPRLGGWYERPSLCSSPMSRGRQRWATGSTPKFCGG